MTGTSGDWTIAALPVGRYELTFELSGFKKLTRSDVQVEAAVTRQLRVVLEVGTLSEQVTVSADAPILVANTAATYRRIAAEELTQVPTSTRSFTHLLSAEAGVSADLPPVLINGTGNISPSVNGTRTTSTSLFFNGIDATNITSNEGSMSDNISPAPEMLEEVKLQTSLYDASTGRSGGGNFQLITRSGYESAPRRRCTSMSSTRTSTRNDFFYEKDGIDKPKARRNEGGLTIGGPIRRNRMFFFGGYQRTDAETGFVPTASSITVLPEALASHPGRPHEGESLAGVLALNPGILASIPKAQCTSADRHGVHLRRRAVVCSTCATRSPATSSLPAPRAGLPVVGRDGVAGSSVGGNPLVRQRNVVPAKFEQDQYTAKLDAQLTNNQRLSGTVFYADFPGLDPFPDPSSLASRLRFDAPTGTRRPPCRTTGCSASNKVNEIRGGVFYLR